MDWFRFRGYYCIRSYASKGTFDFIAVPPKTFKTDVEYPEGWDFTKPYLVQAKTNGYVKPLERQTLKRAQEMYNGMVIVMWREKLKILFKRADEIKL